MTSLIEHFFSYVKNLTKLIKQKVFLKKKLANVRNIMMCVSKE